ncbi:hypothetical protein [Microcella humidisoli]|uniref:Uncharacterized protein n=1 Tax=Microcella humidisoli TaxID=2963406 RepID=A0ABY5FUZ4_9MICO|nr:hypothetical protein [Microcella humidisoli]UTT62115.1 hypothetical protein NNL39_10655 [Microcella humidisoli]
MTEPTPPPASNPHRVFIPVGLLFIVLGTAFLFIDEMTVVGFTFIPAGVVFLSIGIPTRRSNAAPARTKRDGGDGGLIASDTRSSESRETESGGPGDGQTGLGGGFDGGGSSGGSGGGSSGDGGGGGGGD